MIESVEQLDEFMAKPSSKLVEFMSNLRGRMVVVGASGKMGPTLCLLAANAIRESAAKLELIAASRFSDPSSQAWFDRRGIQALSVDLLDPNQIGSLPDADYVIYLVGLKFGTSVHPGATWAANTLAPAAIMERYPKARIVALSTGNVYPFVEANSQGSVEEDELTPLGEYPNAAVARERIFGYFSQRMGTPVAILRLNYALDLRYGVLVDLATKIWRDEPVSLTMGYFNAIWQGDANELILRSLSLSQSPSTAWNLTSLAKYSVRSVATHLGKLLGKSPRFEGVEAETALLSDSRKLFAELGEPAIDFESVLTWTSDWIRNGRPLLGKPTHFETRNGAY